MADAHPFSHPFSERPPSPNERECIDEDDPPEMFCENAAGDLTVGEGPSQAAKELVKRNQQRCLAATTVFVQSGEVFDHTEGKLVVCTFA